MAVLGLPILPVVVPFLQVSGRADLVGTQAGEHGGGFGDEVVVRGERAGGGHGVREAFPNDG